MTLRPRWITAAAVGAMVACLGAASTSGVEETTLRVSAPNVEESIDKATVPDVRLRVPPELAMGAPVNFMNQMGSIPVVVGVSRLDGGQLRVGPNLWGGKGLRFPAYDGRTAPPRAIVRVTHEARSGDPFAPRSNDFEFSIYFKKDANSAGTAVDDGDNLMQRGLASEPAQYKLEVDRDRPSCTIKGDRGQVIVTSSVTVNPALWYQARCSRTGSTVQLVVREHREDGSVRTVKSTRSGTIGSLIWPRGETPIAIGGKLAYNGAVIRSATDQFNGWATYPLLEIDN